MKATEVFVEQVIVGVGALVIGLLPFAPELLEWWARNGDGVDLELVAIGGVLVVGACYLVGILLDRFIDTLLQRLDGHHRLRVALRKCKAEADVPTEDPFQEARYKMAVLEMGGEVASWHDYLRSRIRLSRFLAVALPGLTVSAVVAAARLSPRAGLAPLLTPEPEGVLVGVAAVYLVSCLLVASVGRWLLPAPPTDEGKTVLEKYARRRGYFKGWPRYRALRVWISLVCDVATDPAVWGAAVLLLAACGLTACYRGQGTSPPWALPVAGALLTALAGWTWWRILGTYRGFIRRASEAHERARKEKRAAAAG